MNLVQVVVLLGVLIVGIAIGVLWQTVRELKSKDQALKEEIEKLKEAQAKRLPYDVANSLENATAAINRILFEADFRKELAENALAHLWKARSNGKGKPGKDL